MLATQPTAIFHEETIAVPILHWNHPSTCHRLRLDVTNIIPLGAGFSGQMQMATHENHGCKLMVVDISVLCQHFFVQCSYIIGLGKYFVFVPL